MTISKPEEWVLLSLNQQKIMFFVKQDCTKLDFTSMMDILDQCCITSNVRQDMIGVIRHFNCSILDFRSQSCQPNLSIMIFNNLRTPDINIKYYRRQNTKNKITSPSPCTQFKMYKGFQTYNSLSLSLSIYIYIYLSIYLSFSTPLNLPSLSNLVQFDGCKLKT